MSKRTIRAGVMGCALALGWGTGCQDSQLTESAAFGTVNTTAGRVSDHGTGPMQLSTKTTSGGAGSLGLTNEVPPDLVYGSGLRGYGQQAEAVGGSGDEGGQAEPLPADEAPATDSPQ